MPQSEEEWGEIANGFASKQPCPHCIATMDSKHVQILKPENKCSVYICNGTFSIVLFAVVDAHYNMTYADVYCQGRISEGAALKKEKLFKRMIQLPAEHFTQKNIGSFIRIHVR
jgi:nitroimidazol reductase NimA-like FMN-containing flavoprotein (pyridoxamine 5'-phosphate oxidase superfamily)